MPPHLPSSILHCLKQRAKLKRPQGASVVCGDQEISAPWDWVLGDPVVGTFAPALYVIDQNGLIDLPDALRQRVRGIYFQVTAAWVRRSARLQPLLAQLDQAGIDVIPLKGAALLDTHYKYVGLRPMADIDLLVRPGDFLPAAEVLTTAGLRPGMNSEDNDPFAFRDLPRDFWPLELPFEVERGLLIDLHQHLVAFHWFKPAFPFTPEALWARRITHPPGAASPNPDQPDLWGARLSPGDMLAHLCLHPAFHGFRDIKSFLDIDACIRHLPGDWDWSAFMAIAEEWGVRNCAYHAFKFSRFFFDTPVPDGVLAELDPGGLLRYQVSALTSAQAVLRDRPTLGVRFQPLVLFALFDSPSRQLRTLFNALFPPRTWLQDHPEYHSLFAHWRFIIRRLFRKPA